MKRLCIQQRDATDCGAACLAAISAYFGLNLPIARIRALAGTSQRGTTALGLVESAAKLGLSMQGVKGTIDQIDTVPLPAIAHCFIDGKFLHYVVLVSLNSKSVRVMDPAVGKIERWPIEKFAARWTGVLLLAAPSPEFERGDKTISPRRRIWELLKPHRSAWVQALVGAILSTLLALTTSIFVQKIVDNVVPDGNRNLLNLLGVAMVFILALRIGFYWVQGRLALRAAQRIDAVLILGYFRHLLALPQSFFETMRVGEIISRLNDAVKIRDFLNYTLLDLLLQPLILIGALAAMFFYSWKLAVISLIFLPANGVIYWIQDRMNRRYRRQLMERSADFEAEVVESLQVQPTLRAHQLETHTLHKIQNRFVRLLQTSWSAETTVLGARTGDYLMANVLSLGLLWFGTSQVLDVALTPGQMMSCFSLSAYLTGPMTALLGMNTAIRETLTATDRLFEVMDLEREERDGLQDFVYTPDSDLVFDRASFKHPGRLPVFENLSLRFRAGTITVLNGESGCGKSSILLLLQKLYCLNSGTLSWGDIDLKYVRPSSLRQHLAVLPQRIDLVRGTVLDNIVAGDPTPDLARVTQICRSIGALGFIEKLPGGLHAYLMENGHNLSGGQRQRLAIARALYRPAELLLLDEPSSALDEEAEHRLITVLEERRRAGQTIVISTHSTRFRSIADQEIDISLKKHFPEMVAVAAPLQNCRS